MASRLVSCAAILTLCTTLLLAQDKKKAAAPPDMEKAMAAMAAHGTPGEAHAVLKQLAGKWNYTGKMWWDPTGDPIAMTGTSEQQMIMDGRFLVTLVKGDPPMPFEGRGCYGYDNAKKKYWYGWVDSMTTSLMTAEGSYDPKTKTFTFTSEGYDPMEGKVCKGRDTIAIKSKDEVVHTFYKLADGKEIKVMEITSKRAS